MRINNGLISSKRNNPARPSQRSSPTTLLIRTITQLSESKNNSITSKKFFREVSHGHYYLSVGVFIGRRFMYSHLRLHWAYLHLWYILFSHGIYSRLYRLFSPRQHRCWRFLHEWWWLRRLKYGVRL